MRQIDEFSASIALTFNNARHERVALWAFPGRLPANRDDAYLIQDAQIALRGEEVSGWKVAMTGPAFLQPFGEERLAGPIFRSRKFTCADQGLVPWVVIPNGFAAAEAEFVAIMGRDAPTFEGIPSAEEVIPLIGSFHAGMELAGSPLASINDLGPTAVVSDCGNNDGVVLGPEIRSWRLGGIDALSVRVLVDGKVAGTGSAANIRGGPLAAIAFLIAHLEMRGRPLKAGQVVSTGALTGIHKVRAGQSVQADFGAGMVMNVSVR